MNSQLFLISELEDQGVSYGPPTAQDLAANPDVNLVTLGGLPYRVVGYIEGETRRWTRTDAYVVRDQEGRCWAIPYEANPSDHEAGADGFRSHATDHGNQEYVKSWEVREVPVTTMTWVDV